MLKEYTVHYMLKSGYKTAIIVKNLEEVRKTKRAIRDAGYGFLGVEWRERSKYRIPDNVGWQRF